MNRPVPYATYQSKNELPALSKNKDIQKFQEDVVEMINPKSNQKLQDKLFSKDQKLNILLEKNLEDPSNQWQPSDHSLDFMKGLRRY